MAFELPKLAFAYDALEPHMSKDTLHFHHDKHHRSYVEKLNKAIADTAFADLRLEDIILKTADEPKDRGIFNNAAQHWNHSFFWTCMAAKGGQPKGELAERIDSDFGGYESFVDKFVDVATGQFGSGWAWLVYDKGNLSVTATSNAELPLIAGQHALLTCDLWEHAYYLDYQNRRSDFVKRFLEQVVNWEHVAEYLRMADEGSYEAGYRLDGAA